MFETTSFLTFVGAAVALLVVPGPAVMYIIARSVHQGRQAGLVSVLGIQVGAIFHIAAAALGLSVILVSSAVAFSVLKLLGAAYLIYLGIRTLRQPVSTHKIGAPPRQSLRRIFSQGIVVNLLNPKTALFFFAFLPQFVDVDRGSAPLQIVVLGLIFITLAIVSDSLYALLAGALGQRLQPNSAFLQRQRYMVGSVYIGLGMATMFARTDH